MYARVITAEVDPNGMEGVIRVAHQQLPDAGQQPGFSGFYLLADREAGRLMTISLWETRDNAVAAEERATRLRSQTAQSVGVAVPDVALYEVVMGA
jgi:heme-degrading monooxygenase HmoA